jgi:hypothetical protein
MHVAFSCHLPDQAVAIEINAEARFQAEGRC